MRHCPRTTELSSSQREEENSCFFGTLFFLERKKGVLSSLRRKREEYGVYPMYILLPRTRPCARRRQETGSVTEACMIMGSSGTPTCRIGSTTLLRKKSSESLVSVTRQYHCSSRSNWGRGYELVQRELVLGLRNNVQWIVEFALFCMQATATRQDEGVAKRGQVAAPSQTRVQAPQANQAMSSCQHRLHTGQAPPPDQATAPSPCQRASAWKAPKQTNQKWCEG